MFDISFKRENETPLKRNDATLGQYIVYMVSG